MIIFKFITFCNFKAPFSCFKVNFGVSTPSFFHSRQEFIISGGKAMHYFNRLLKKWKSYEWILWSRWIPIVLMWLYGTQKEDKRKVHFWHLDSLPLLHFPWSMSQPLLISISWFLFSSNSCLFRVLKSLFSFGPHYSSCQILVACSIIF